MCNLVSSPDLKVQQNCFGDICHLLRGFIATVFSDQTWIIFLTTIKECDIVEPTITVSLQEELVELHLDYLVTKQKQKRDVTCFFLCWVCNACMLGVSMSPTILGSTVISQEQLAPGGYFLSGQLGVMISPWAFVIFPPQNCWSETSHTNTLNKGNNRLN